MAGTQAALSDIRNRQQTKSLDIIKTLTEFYTRISPGEDPEKVRLAVNTTITAYFGIGVITSIADIGSDFFDFSIGRSLSDIMHPMIEATIIEPIRDAIKPIVRLNSPSERFLLGILEAGLIDETLIRRALLDHRIRPEFLEPILQFAGRKHEEAAAKINTEVSTAIDSQHALLFEKELNRFEGDLKRIEDEVVVLADQARELPLSQKISLADRTASKIERLIDTIVSNTGKPQDRALLLLGFTMSKAGRIK